MGTVMEHNPDCDVMDINPEGIRKPCNCAQSSLSQPTKKIALLYSGPVGEKIRDFLRRDRGLIIRECLPENWRNDYDDLGCRVAPAWLRDLAPDWLICAWWPIIVPDCALICCTHTINIHNSLLPWCRGKHPNFWSIIEGVPYGVTLHEVTRRIDGGGIYVRQSLSVDWTDTGETLHRRALDLAVDLFCRSWPAVADGTLKPGAPVHGGSFHQANELESASEIPMGVTTGREVLNIIRARQAYGHAAWFVDRGERYKVTLTIQTDDAPKNGPARTFP